MIDEFTIQFWYGMTKDIRIMQFHPDKVLKTSLNSYFYSEFL